MNDNDVSEISIPRFTLMAIECLNIVNTTKKISVFKTRFASLIEHVNYLALKEGLNSFAKLSNDGIRLFAEMYPKIEMTSLFYSVTAPNQVKALLPNLYKELLFKVLIKEAEVSGDQINNCKKESTKLKKIEELINFLKEHISEFDEFIEQDKIFIIQLQNNIRSIGNVFDKIKQGDGKL